MFLANEATIAAAFVLDRLPCLDLSYVNGAAFSLSFCLLFSAYLHFVVRRFVPGPTRLSLASPLLVTLLASPSLVFNATTHLSGTLVLAGLLMWWSTFKIFAFCLGRGPLSAPIAESFIPFTFLAVLPVKLEEQGKEKVAPWYYSLMYFFAKAVGVFVSVALMDVVSDFPIAVHTLYIALLFLFVSVVMDLPASILSACGIPLSAHFNSPFLADSLEDFWSHRWNMTASALLRDAVYKPIVSLYFSLAASDEGSRESASPSSDMEASKPKSVRRSSPVWLKSLAVIATFAVSGLMHELILLHSTRIVTWEWFWFFTVHGIGVVFEASVLRSINAPPIMLRIFFYAFCIYTLETLFWPPLIAARFDERLLGEYRISASTPAAI